MFRINLNLYSFIYHKMSSKEIMSSSINDESDDGSLQHSSGNHNNSSGVPQLSKNKSMKTKRALSIKQENGLSSNNNQNQSKYQDVPLNNAKCQYPLHPGNVTDFVDIDVRRSNQEQENSKQNYSNIKGATEDTHDDNMRVFSINEINEGFPNNYISTTKYSLITFFPLCLLKQFARIANVYFLVIAILASIPQISSLTPYTAIFPLVFVLLVSIFREGVEDFYRYRSDRASNSKKVKRLGSEGTFEDAWSKDLEVGDIVFVEGEDTFAADMILLKSSNEVNAFIQTSSLDGEKNLKKRFVPKSLEALTKPVSEKEYLLGGKCTTLPPDKDLKSFVGTLKVSNKVFSLNIQQLMLKDSKLKNTSWIIGAVVYTGKHTKVMMNSQKARVKRSNLEK